MYSRFIQGLNFTLSQKKTLNWGNYICFVIRNMFYQLEYVLCVTPVRIWWKGSWRHLFQIAKYLCLKITKWFVSNCKIFVSQIDKNTVFKLQSICVSNWPNYLFQIATNCEEDLVKGALEAWWEFNSNHSAATNTPLSHFLHLLLSNLQKLQVVSHSNTNTPLSHLQQSIICDCLFLLVLYYSSYSPFCSSFSWLGCKQCLN